MIAIIKYNAGNATSVANAVKKLGYSCVITDDPQIIQSAEKVIFPGVGEASSAMKYLKSTNLDELIIGLEQPVLGICLGMQLMCSWSEEGNTVGLNIFSCKVNRFPPLDIVPQMGWNQLLNTIGVLFDEFPDNGDVYFVHSYYADLCEFTIAEGDYILPFSAALQKDNFYGTQFHPEKSGQLGQIILNNFLAL